MIYSQHTNDDTTKMVNKIVLCIMMMFFCVILLNPTVNSQSDSDNPNPENKFKLIQSIIELLGINRSTTLCSLYPEIGLNYQNAIPDACYDPDVGGIKVNIFKETIQKVVHTYFETHKYQLEHKNALLVTQRIRLLIENLKPLAEAILKCVTDPVEEQTRLGLTSLAAYSRQEYNSMLNHRLSEDSDGDEDDDDDE